MSVDDSFKTGGGLAEFHSVVQDGGQDLLLGQQVGNYTIDSLLAEGGMGRVYRARRSDGSFERDVAIKLLPPGMGGEYLQRFEQERQILATLNHDSIAQLFDAGVTESGAPYLVMELIDGEPIDAYARTVRLSVNAKVRLILTLCETLTFAHSQLVIHRDIKPSNVFVDNDGRLKLLDFGISKILEAPAGVTVDSRPMTPRYASPEQLLSEPVSVASDVYQVGLLFLSLFDQRDDAEPETQASVTERALHKRSITVDQRLAEPLPVELAAIINQCLRADPAERYASAFDVAADLRNFLTGHPVSARNPGAFARGVKFLKRNWLPSAAVAVTFVSLIGFLVVTLQQQAATEAARAAAERQQQRAEQVTAFLIDLFEASSPSEALGAELSARDLLTRGLAKIDKLDDEPELKIELLEVISHVFRNLGDYQTALELAEQTLALKETVYADEPLEIATTLELIARIHNWYGRLDEGLDVSRRVVDIRRKELGPDAEATLDALVVVASSERRRKNFDAARTAYELVLQGKRRLYGDSHSRVTAALSNLASIHWQLGNFYEAAEYMEEVISRNEQELPANHPDAAADWYTYGRILGRIGRYDGSIDALQRSATICLEVYGDDHPYTAWSLSALGLFQAKSGRYTSAVANMERAVEIRQKTSERPHPSIAETLLEYAWLLIEVGRSSEAEDVINDASAQYAEFVATDAVEILYSRLLLARSMIEQNRAAEALELFGPVVANEDGNPALDSARIDYSRAFRRLGRLEEAEHASRSAISLLTEARSERYPEVSDAQLELALVLIDAGKPIEAGEIAARAAAGYRASLPAGHWKHSAAIVVMIEAADLGGEYASQAENLAEHVEILTATLPSSNEFVRRGSELRDRLQNDPVVKSSG